MSHTSIEPRVEETRNRISVYCYINTYEREVIRLSREERSYVNESGEWAVHKQDSETPFISDLYMIRVCYRLATDTLKKKVTKEREMNDA